MTDQELKDIAFAAMAGAWIRRLAMDMVAPSDKLRLAAQVSALDSKEVGEVSAVMIEALDRYLKQKRSERDQMLIRNRAEAESLREKIAATGDPDGTLAARLLGLSVATAQVAAS